MEGGIHISLAAEQITTLWGIPITNTLITSWVVMVLLIGLAFFFSRRPQLVPGRVQFVLEFIVTYVYDFMRETLENDKVARRYLPLLCTFFIFIATSNLLEFTPGIGSIGIVHGDGLIPHVAMSMGFKTDLEPRSHRFVRTWKNRSKALWANL